MTIQTATDGIRYRAAANVLMWVCAASLTLAGCDSSVGRPSEQPLSRATSAAAAPLSTSPASRRSETTFRSPTTYTSAQGVDADVSSDGKAFTIRFAAMEAKVEAGNSASPVATHVFPFVVPVDGGGDGVKISFAASGYAFTTAGASGYAVVSVNGQTSTMRFPSGTDQEFVQQLEFEAGPSSECLVTLVVLVDRGSADAAYVNFSSLDAEIVTRTT